jgi:MtN3 and saliva related transmembrane protein
MPWLIIGFLAAFLTMSAFIPQMIKVVKTKSVKDVSLITLFQLSCGVSFWIAYGVHLRDIVVITANVFTLLTLLGLLFLYYHYNRKIKEIK